MNVNLPWKKTLLALSISGLVACGGGGGGGAPDNSAGGGTRGDSINKENAAAIVSLTAEGGAAGKNSKTPNQTNNSSTRSKIDMTSRAGESDEDDSDSESDDDDFDGETDISELIGQKYQETYECEVKGKSSYDLTFVQPQANELYRFEGSMSFDDCQEDKSDYAYDGTVQIIYGGNDEQDSMQITGEYTQSHKSGVEIVTTNYSETATSTETEYSSTYSYDATGTPFGDKKVHVKTIAPIVTNDESETPLSGAIRVESEDRSFLVMTVTPDGLGVEVSVNGEPGEFKSWSELDSVDLNGYVVDDEEGEDDDSSDDEGSDDEGSDDEGSDDSDDGSSDDDSTDEDSGGDEDEGDDNETDEDDEEWEEEWEDEEGDDESEEDSEDE